MEVFEVKLKLFLLKDVQFTEIQSKISSFIDMGLAKDEKYLEFHNENKFKNYCFDSLYPIEKDKIYNSGKIYTLTLRTVGEDLAKFFLERLKNEYDENFKGLTAEVRIVPKKHIEKIYSITPMLIKNDCGYWKGKITLDEFERRLKENLIKKYNSIANEKIDEDFQLYTSIEFKNRKPISTSYKQIKLLGDKISINISDDKRAQDLAYMSLGTGIAEMNPRGYGFVNYRWL
ncbi:CRISPR-associated endoribonuclease Cas6 [Clostridium manihotivorum]|uniref:CRISPR-associated endoribonuclease Cas6 n=1 Tax=Clostridium manihotivorum TaxID=2320868 RepID=A0A410DWN4_9CLOT|nr:CRISPR-associated endoribonuclease Cas6 [Clostridium manihotivorum]QAA33499.1 CRISPR-associated endoribonuclease Cas6 [Clostridium manihotivorum]